MLIQPEASEDSADFRHVISAHTRKTQNRLNEILPTKKLYKDACLIEVLANPLHVHGSVPNIESVTFGYMFKCPHPYSFRATLHSGPLF